MIQESPMTVTFDVHFATGSRGRKRIRNGTTPSKADMSGGRTQRISRLMALAVRFEQLIEDSEVQDYADLARFGQVTRARLTQIMNLTLLAPDIQEDILFLQPVLRGRDPISERHLRPIAAEPDWRKQRKMWGAVNSPVRD